MFVFIFQTSIKHEPSERLTDRVRQCAFDACSALMYPILNSLLSV